MRARLRHPGRDDFWSASRHHEYAAAAEAHRDETISKISHRVKTCWRVKIHRFETLRQKRLARRASRRHSMAVGTRSPARTSLLVDEGWAGSDMRSSCDGCWSRIVLSATDYGHGPGATLPEIAGAIASPRLDHQHLETLSRRHTRARRFAAIAKLTVWMEREGMRCNMSRTG